MSLSTELWHTSTSYFRFHLSSELRADCGCCGFERDVPSDDDDDEDDKEEHDDVDEGEVVTLPTEDNNLFVTFVSCSHCADTDALDFKNFWIQPCMSSLCLFNASPKVLPENVFNDLICQKGSSPPHTHTLPMVAEQITAATECNKDKVETLMVVTDIPRKKTEVGNC